MSDIKNIANLANLLDANIEDKYGIPHSMQGCVYFGPINCADVGANRFIFGVDIDQHFREAGWTLVTKNGAAATIASTIFPDDHEERDPRTGDIGYPNDLPGFTMHWVQDDGGDDVRTFNPKLYDVGPSGAWESGIPFIIWVREQETGDGTWSKMVEEALGGLSLGPTSTMSYTGIFPLADFGSLSNERSLSFNSFFTLGSDEQGAGKTWESKVLNSMKMRVHLSYAGGWTPLTVMVTVLVQDSGSATGWSLVGDHAKNPSITYMRGESDYLFLLDSYSFYVISHNLPGYPNNSWLTRLFCTMVDTASAMPQHVDWDPIPQVALVSYVSGLENDETFSRWFVGPPANATFDQADGNEDLESGWCVEVVRAGPVPLINSDDSDIFANARVCFSTDYSGPGGILGPMRYLGQMWNAAVVQRDGEVLQDYSLESTGDLTEVALPKRYKTLLRQSGAEWQNRGSQGSVLLAVADYDYFRATYEAPDPTNPPIGIRVTREWNLFAKEHPGEFGKVDFLATGGQPVDPDPGHYVPPQYTWIITGFPTGWSASSHGDTAEISGKSYEPAWKKFPDPPDLGKNGRFSVSIKVSDTFGNFREMAYRLVVGTPCYPRVVMSDEQVSMDSSGDPVLVGSFYSRAMLAFGGSGHFVDWEVADGSIPGLSLDASSGILSGTPISGGVHTFSLRFTDLITGEISFPKTLNMTIL